MLVFMRLSQKYAVPCDLALLYDFANTLDRRCYVAHGTPRAGGDEVASPRQLEAWMRGHHLTVRGKHVGAAEHRQALELRSALRGFLELPPAARDDSEAARRLSAISRHFPLNLTVSDDGSVKLAAAPGASTLGLVLAEMLSLAETNRLARLKACASEECHWIFFDRSKPANRHWCSSVLCGNRQKTRDYRQRQKLTQATQI
jgi:predicted RNA-binding Zn ribbon-like protein